MVRFLNLPVLICAASVAGSAMATQLLWKDTKFLITFGDSYTTTGFNISAGVDSPVPNFTSSNGPNWVQQLETTFNVAGTKVFNLASGGATIDAALVPPFQPTVLSVVDQVTQFKQFLASKPPGARWSSNNTLFAFWIGINDVGQSFGWLDQLHDEGARSFAFLTVPAIDRAPLWAQQGPDVALKMKTFVAEYNTLLRTMVANFQAKHKDLQRVTVIDTQPIFNTLLNNAPTLGFVNSTGWCEAYQNGTPQIATESPPCAPVSTYL
ncbi:hypothetical protein CVT24_009362 [Panaeolus cyanescens]|uniref:Carbohydrate esterase family 16 protein n=1 Tax=Panaeolus cyanescens TaxID=181874 RepID=A0A409Y7M5_9AGAR|nr:hypothetical protein CVT24_009362 [Panaeolus cyanescens]